MNSLKSIIFVFSFLFVNTINGQDFCFGEEHFKSVLYLNNSVVVQDKLIQTFSHLQRRKKDPVSYTIATEFELIPIYFFHYMLEDGDVTVDKRLILNQDLYQQEYSARVVENDILPRSETLLDAKVTLVLSPLIENFLVAEFLETEANIGPYKSGRALQVLFIFDEQKDIQKVLYASPLYN
ncbi:MAG: hypothetical protein AAFO02_07200 [Bacteroidota bacterium]